MFRWLQKLSGVVFRKMFGEGSKPSSPRLYYPDDPVCHSDQFPIFGHPTRMSMVDGPHCASTDAVDESPVVAGKISPPRGAVRRLVGNARRPLTSAEVDRRERIARIYNTHEQLKLAMVLLQNGHLAMFRGTKVTVDDLPRLLRCLRKASRRLVSLTAGKYVAVECLTVSCQKSDFPAWLQRSLQPSRN